VTGYNIPVEDGWADLACCRYILMHLSDRLGTIPYKVNVPSKADAQWRHDYEPRRFDASFRAVIVFFKK
jgi:hypothetical protein